MSFFHDASNPPSANQIASGSGLILENVPCDSTVYVGAAVYLNGAGIAHNGLADDEATSNIIGIVISKASSLLCTIRVLGVTPAIFAGLDVTKEYFLSDTVAGEITTTVPTNSGHVVLKLGQPFSTDKFVVIKSTRMVRT